MPVWLTNVTMSGYVWVTFFFMLSGFILVYTARDLHSAAARRDFYIRRAARILPAYLFAWFLFAICQLTDPTISLIYWLKSTGIFGGLALGFIQGWIPGAAEYWNTPGWSLSCEAFFYLSFPAIFLVATTATRRTLSTALLALACTNAVTVLLIAHLETSPLLVGTVFATDWGSFLRDHPIVQIQQFVTGVLLGRMFVDGARLPRPFVWLLVCIAAVVALSLLEYRDVRRDALLVPIFGLSIYALASLPQPPAGRLANVGILLGNASYAIYILQEPIWYLYADAAHSPRWGGTTSLASMVLFLTILIGFSVFFYQQVEKRTEPALRRLLQRLIDDRMRTRFRPASQISSARSAE